MSYIPQHPRDRCRFVNPVLKGRVTLRYRLVEHLARTNDWTGVQSLVRANRGYVDPAVALRFIQRRIDIGKFRAERPFEQRLREGASQIVRTTLRDLVKAGFVEVRGNPKSPDREYRLVDPELPEKSLAFWKKEVSPIERA